MGNGGNSRNLPETFFDRAYSCVASLQSGSDCVSYQLKNKLEPKNIVVEPDPELFEGAGSEIICRSLIRN